jgi:hypothetical protein
MTKIKLYGIGNDGDFNFYIFDKKQEVADRLCIILKNIFRVYWELDYIKTNKKGKSFAKTVKIKNNKDYCETLGSSVHIFYGDKKMFLTINCSQKERLKFNEELFKFAEMPKPKNES